MRSYTGSAPGVEYSPARRWKLGAFAGAYAVHRPGWLDQYQPQPDGFLGTTDRYSHWDRNVSGFVRWGTFKKLRIKVSYRFSVIDYADDPAYDPNAEPTHLVPGDRLEHALSLDVHRRWGPISVKPGVDATYRHYFNAYARDAGTGLTHAGAGGLPPNPVLRFWDVEPGVRIEAEALEDVLTLTVGYAHAFTVDIFDGYYSYQGPHPSLKLEYSPTKSIDLTLRSDVELRNYGPNGYAEGGAHPPLEEGSRRKERRYRLALRAMYSLSKRFALVFEGDWVRKESNLPDYVPGVYPASRQYSIDWDTTNTTVAGGVKVGFK